MKHILSDEMLCAYIDGEIDGQERERIIAMEATDKDLAAKIGEMRKLKNFVKAARASEPNYSSSYVLNKSKKYHYRYHKSKMLKTSCLAASMLVVVAVAAYGVFDFSRHQDLFYTESTNLDVNRLLSEVSVKSNLHLVMHINTENVKRADHLLALLEAALKKSGENNNNLHVEVIASGPGLHFLQKSKVTSEIRIRKLKQTYQNLTFLACEKTLHKLENKSGKAIQIIDDAMLIASGPEWIKKRKANGWAYILI